MTTIKQVAEVFADALGRRANRIPSNDAAVYPLRAVAAALRDVAAQGEERERGMVCMFCGEAFGYAGQEPDVDTMKAACEHEAKCKSNPYIAERDAARAEADKLRSELSALRAEPTEDQCRKAAKSIWGNENAFYQGLTSNVLAAWRKVLGGENAEGHGRAVARTLDADVGAERITR